MKFLSAILALSLGMTGISTAQMNPKANQAIEDRPGLLEGKKGMVEMSHARGNIQFKQSKYLNNGDGKKTVRTKSVAEEQLMPIGMEKNKIEDEKDKMEDKEDKGEGQIKIKF